MLGWGLAGVAGFEPTTVRLTVGCSAVELHSNAMQSVYMITGFLSTGLGRKSKLKPLDNSIKKQIPECSLLYNAAWRILKDWLITN